MKEPNNDGLSYIPKARKVSCGNPQTLRTGRLQPKAIWANTEKQNDYFTKKQNRKII